MKLVKPNGLETCICGLDVLVWITDDGQTEFGAHFSPDNYLVFCSGRPSKETNMKTKRTKHTEGTSSSKTGNEAKRSDHTPTPWKVVDNNIVTDDGSSEYIGTIDGEPYENLGESSHNAAFIVRAVNAHETLLDAVRFALKLAQVDYDDAKVKRLPQATVDAMFTTVKAFRDAIALAEGK
jgi:hypothetical protein